MMEGVTTPREPLLYDEPITNDAQDRFRRAALAAQVADVLAAMAADGRSSVVAVVGPWGSGKSSLLALVKKALRTNTAAQVVDFNPWMVGSVEALVRDFFATLMSAIPDNDRAGNIREAVAKYGGMASPLLEAIPIVGRTLASVGKEAANALKDGPSLSSLHRDAEEALGGLEHPIVVVVDDIDRLQGDELLAVFKLIRLVGRLRNVHYLLSFDDETVRDVLAEEPLARRQAGRALAFLEKIVQVRVDIPPLHPYDTDALVRESLTSALQRSDVQLSENDNQRFGSIYRNILRPDLTQPRQIKRLFAQFEVTLPLVRREVNTLDFLLLTHLRVGYSDLYGRLAQSRDELTISVGSLLVMRSQAAEERQETWKKFVERVVDEDQVPRALRLMAELFPPVASALHGRSLSESILRAERRIGAPEYFDRYFQLGIPPGDVPDSQIYASVNAIVAGDLVADEVRELRSLALRDGGLALNKMISAWTSIGRPIIAPLIEFLIDIHEQLATEEHDLLSLDWNIETWIADMAASASENDITEILGATLQSRSGLRMLTRSLYIASQQEPRPQGPGYVRGVNEAMLALRTTLLAAASEPIDHHEDLVWMLRAAAAFGDSQVVRRWISEVLDVTVWTTRDLVGCFTPIATNYATGERSLADFFLEGLVELMPLQDVFEKLSEDLDTVELTPIAGSKDDLSFATRVRLALAALRRLRDRRPADPEPSGLSVDQLGPSRYATADWAPGDLTIRTVVALPAAVTREGFGSSVGPQVGIERREDLVRSLIHQSGFTAWVSELGDTWHWSEHPAWESVASVNEASTEFRFKPASDTGTSPFRMRIVIQTGTSGAHAPSADAPPALQLIHDLHLNLLELDDQRRPASTRHATTTPPAPAALSIEEVGRYALVCLKESVALARNAAAALLSESPRAGEVATFLLLGGVELERVIDLGRLPRRAGAVSRTEWERRSEWPLPPSVWGVPADQAFIAEFVHHMLESSGYRRLGPVTDAIRNQPKPAGL